MPAFQDTHCGNRRTCLQPLRESLIPKKVLLTPGFQEWERYHDLDRFGNRGTAFRKKEVIIEQ